MNIKRSLFSFNNIIKKDVNSDVIRHKVFCKGSAPGSYCAFGCAIDRLEGAYDECGSAGEVDDVAVSLVRPPEDFFPRVNDFSGPFLLNADLSTTVM